MSMIAKLSINKITQYGHGALVELNCVASNETMAFSAGSEEDKLFSQASPSGSMHVQQPAGHALGNGPVGLAQGEQFYAMCLGEDEHRDPDFKGAYAFVLAQCGSITDFGGTSKQLQFRAGSSQYSKAARRGVEGFWWQMSVDNPRASGQIVAGKNYWIALYPVEKFTRDEAIAAAHRAPVVEDEGKELVGG